MNTSRNCNNFGAADSIILSCPNQSSQYPYKKDKSGSPMNWIMITLKESWRWICSNKRSTTSSYRLKCFKVSKHYQRSWMEFVSWDMIQVHCYRRSSVCLLNIYSYKMDFNLFMIHIMLIICVCWLSFRSNSSANGT